MDRPPLRRGGNCEIMGPTNSSYEDFHLERRQAPCRICHAGASCSGRRSPAESLALGSLVGHGPLIDFGVRVAHADEPIKIGILDPLSSPYKTSSIHDVHGANVAVDLFNKKGGVLGRPVAILEADDASNPDQAVKVATKVHQGRPSRCAHGDVQRRLRPRSECVGGRRKTSSSW